MAYWRNYRKFSAEAGAVANAESSEEDCQNEQHHNETSLLRVFQALIVQTWTMS